MMHFYVFLLLESRTNFRFQPDGFSFFLEEFPLPLVFRPDAIGQWCPAVLQRKAESTSSSAPEAAETLPSEMSILGCIFDIERIIRKYLV